MNIAVDRTFARSSIFKWQERSLSVDRHLTRRAVMVMLYSRVLTTDQTLMVLKIQGPIA